MYLNFRFLGKYANQLLAGVGMTIVISLASMILGFLIGLLVAVMRRSQNKALQTAGTIWVEFLRNTPFLVQLFFCFFGLPQLGIRTDPIITAILALSLNSSAGNCEVIRSGLMAVKKGYYECAGALGLTSAETFRYIVMPISLRVAFKPLTSNFINLILTSSVAFSITVSELMGVSKTVAAKTSQPFEVYIMIMLSYCVLTFSLSFLAKYIDRKIALSL
ncbi:MAG: amino acid ABC transporter permease [Rectinemataceae bacterium]|jgi:His/Glu/Gln/Arg/opine family amino acid ABC transporter permease subunit